MTTKQAAPATPLANIANCPEPWRSGYDELREHYASVSERMDRLMAEREQLVAALRKSVSYLLGEHMGRKELALFESDALALLRQIEGEK